MQKYIGTKVILATPMTRDAAEKILGRDVGGNHHGDGYLVEYDGGYQSWSPKGVFDEAYRPIDGMTYGLALDALKQGHRVARAGWSKAEWLQLVAGESWHMDSDAISNDSPVRKQPWIGMTTADGGFVPWTASHAEQLAEDWTIL